MTEPQYTLFDPVEPKGLLGNGDKDKEGMSDSLGSNPGVLGAQQLVTDPDGAQLGILGAAVPIGGPGSPQQAVGQQPQHQSRQMSHSVSSRSGSLTGSIHSIGGMIPAAAPIPGTAPAGSQANLIVNYIPIEITESQFEQLFAQYGEVESAKIVTEKGSGASKGYGFVKYANAESAKEAMAKLDGYAIYNKRLKVGLAARQQSNSSENAVGSRIVMGSHTSSQTASLNSSIGAHPLPGGVTTLAPAQPIHPGSQGSASGSSLPGSLTGSLQGTPNGLALSPQGAVPPLAANPVPQQQMSPHQLQPVLQAVPQVPAGVTMVSAQPQVLGAPLQQVPMMQPGMMQPMAMQTMVPVGGQPMMMMPQQQQQMMQPQVLGATQPHVGMMQMAPAGTYQPMAYQPVLQQQMPVGMQQQGGTFTAAQQQ